MSEKKDEAANKEREQKRLKKKAARKVERARRRVALKLLGFRPNRKMTRCKKTGKDLRETRKTL